ncbi:MAG: TolC family protein [Pedobacter sp.]|nr:MAG: TolC family protein [Pedobacter sp.]
MSVRFSTKLIIWQFTCLFFLGFSVSNQVQAQQVLSLQEAIQIALKNNYDIQLIQNEVEIVKNNVNPGNAGMLPNLTGDFSTGGSRQNTVQTQSTGTQRVTDGARSTNLRYGVGLNWTIFDGFTMFATFDKLKALEQQGEVNAKSIIVSTVSNVIMAYYDIVRQNQLVISADSSIDVSTMRLHLANQKLELGKGSKLDVLAAQVDYNTDTTNYLQQKNLLRQYKIRLNQLLVRALDTDFEVINQLTIDANLKLGKLVNQATALNPNLQAAFIQKKISELTLKEIKGNRYPRIGVNGGYEHSQSTSPTGFNTEFKADGLTYGITASLPIFNGFLQRQNERNARIAIESSELNYEKTKLDLISQLSTVYQNYFTYLSLLQLEAKNLEIAKQSLNITVEKYRLGSIPPLELREAQRNAINAETRYIETQFQAKLAETTLKELSGSLNME